MYCNFFSSSSVRWFRTKDGWVIIRPSKFTFPPYIHISGGVCVYVCSNDGGVAWKKQGSLLATLQSAGPVFHIMRPAKGLDIKPSCVRKSNSYLFWYLVKLSLLLSILEMQVFGPEISTYFTDPYTFLHFEVRQWRMLQFFIFLSRHNHQKYKICAPFLHGFFTNVFELNF